VKKTTAILSNMLEQALSLHKANEISQAKQLYELILNDDPNNFDALHLLGIVEHQQKNHKRAINLIRTAISVNPYYADAYNNLGNAEKEEGLADSAVKSFKKAIELNPKHADAYSNLGNIFNKITQFESALNCYNEALRIKSNFAEAYFNKGNLLHAIGKFIDAIECFDKAIENRANYYEAYNNKGSSLHAIGNFKHAIASYDSAIEIKRNYAEAYNNRGYSNHLLENYDSAIEDYKKALSFNSNIVEAYHNMANTYIKLSKIDMALMSFNLAISLKSNYANAYHNRGMLLITLGYEISGIEDCKTARNFYLESIKNQPLDQKIMLNLGHINKKLGDFNAAENIFKNILEIFPENHKARESLSRIQLTCGNFEEGWINYISREESPQDRCCIPDILNLNEHSKVLILREQGFGDELFFLRFIEKLKIKIPNLYYQGSKRIKSLINDEDLFNDWIDSNKEIKATDYDAQFAIGNLPAVLGVASEAEIPPPLRLKVNSIYLKQILEKISILKIPSKLIGVTWRGGTEFSDKSLFKQVPLELLGKALKNTLGSIIVLQRNPKPGELQKLSFYAEREIYNFTEENENFESMLALLSLMDEYIGVSNTNMHLMAGLSKPARVLIPFPPEFRWMDKERSPWFPNFSIYRQDRFGSWENAFQDLENDLELKL
jgi:tetratricopeptide (TPR) repeat protein